MRGPAWVQVCGRSGHAAGFVNGEFSAAPACSTTSPLRPSSGATVGTADAQLSLLRFLTLSRGLCASKQGAPCIWTAL